jgi:hypothetical protein
LCSGATYRSGRLGRAVIATTCQRREAQEQVGDGGVLAYHAETVGCAPGVGTCRTNPSCEVVAGTRSRRNNAAACEIASKTEPRGANMQ